jgi:hypothetical protein
MKSEKWYRVFLGEISEITVLKETKNYVDIEHNYNGRVGSRREKKDTDLSFIAKTIKECKDWYYRETAKEINGLENRICSVQMKLEDFILRADALEYQNGANK